MNDRFNYINPASVSGTDSGENGEYENNVSDVPEIDENSTGMVDTVSDAMGSDTDIVADTESGAQSITDIPLDNTENSMESENGYFEDYTQSNDLEYLPELEYIDYLLAEQIQNQIMVQSVSGNSIMVTIDDTGMQMLTEIRDNQYITHEKCDTMINLLGCLLLAVIIEYLVMSSKRIVKKMMNRKD